MLYIYTGTAPNTQHSTFYFGTYANFVNMLLPQRQMTVTPDKYTITTGVIRVAGGAMNASYIIDNDTKRCYFVDNALDKGSFMEYNVSVDNWGSFINSMEFENVVVKRSNKKVGNNGVFAPIKNVQTVPTETEITLRSDAQPFQLGDICAVFRVNEELRSTAATFLGQHSTRTYLCATTLGGVYNLTNIATKIAGIYNRIIAGASDVPVAVDKAWLVPAALVSMSSNQYSFTSRNSQGTDESFSCYLCNNWIIKGFNYTTDIDPDYEYYIGTPYTRMQLPRITGTVTYDVQSLGSNDGIYIYMTCGNNRLDLSDCFDLGMTTNNGAKNAMDSIAHNINNIGQIVTGIGSIAGAGVTGGASLVGAGQIFNGINGYLKANVGSYSQGSNVLGLYIPTSAQRSANSPLRLIKYQSLNDEQEIAMRLGAEFNTYVTLFGNIPNSAWLCSGTWNTDIYLQADVDVTNVPTYAGRYIQSILAQGTRVKWL